MHERVLSLARQKRNNLSGKPPIKLTINIDGLDAETKRNVTHDPEPPVPLPGGTLNRLHEVKPVAEKSPSQRAPNRSPSFIESLHDLPLCLRLKFSPQLFSACSSGESEAPSGGAGDWGIGRGTTTGSSLNAFFSSSDRFRARLA